MNIIKKMCFLTMLMCFFCIISTGKSLASEGGEIDPEINDDGKYTVFEVFYPDEIFVEENLVGKEVDINYLIQNSTNVITRGTSMEGSYSSLPYEVMVGAYEIRFMYDWVAGVDANGDYFFAEVNNPRAVGYEDKFVNQYAFKSISAHTENFTMSYLNNRKIVHFQLTVVTDVVTFEDEAHTHRQFIQDDSDINDLIK